MNLRHLSLTVAALALLSAVAWYLQRPVPPAKDDPRTGQPVLAPALAESAAQVRVADAGKQVTLVRQPDRSWQVQDYFGFPADFAKLRQLVTDLTTAKIQRLVSARADRLARLDFKDTSITLLDAAGKTLWQLTLGKTAESGGRFVRYGEEEKGYLADLAVALDSDAKNWADSALLNLKPDDVASVEIGFPTGPAVAFSRAKKEAPWTARTPVPAGMEVKADRLAAVLSNLTSLHFTDTTAPDDPKAVAARRHRRTIQLTTFDHQTYTLEFGREPEAKVLKAPAPAAPTAAAPASPETKPAAPEYETVPAGPVFVAIACSDAKATVNAQMKQRAFELAEWTYTGLPAAPAEFWEPVPPPPAAKPASPPAKP